MYLPSKGIWISVIRGIELDGCFGNVPFPIPLQVLKNVENMQKTTIYVEHQVAQHWNP